ncbi:translation initiation factor [Olea europaea subsp. europaea]|uniref:Translation initiation factor n=1 Tax=Olea europaea subsp. europaea TaxID=158383 RepID=A0A8S0RCS2_OLEEU|nr:translation initiation factor [Olea europaea subsp. europaea]
MADMDEMFSGMKKVKKTKKVVAQAQNSLHRFDELDIPSEQSSSPAGGSKANGAAQPVEEPAAKEADAVRPLESNADLTLPESSELDFSDLASSILPNYAYCMLIYCLEQKKKKKKAKVAIDLDDVQPQEASEQNNVAAAAAPEGQADAPAEGDGLDDFSDLKKKKKKSKTKTFDIEAFEKELAATETADAANREAGSDGEEGAGPNADLDEVPEGEDPFAEGAGAEGGDKTKAESAYEKKGWISENRDYQYGELLGRFYSLLYQSHPSLSGGSGKKRYTIPPPSMHRDGNKRSVFANIADICKKMHRCASQLDVQRSLLIVLLAFRQPEHVIQFLFAEMGTTGSVDGSGRLVIKGRFQQKQIENILRRYIGQSLSLQLRTSLTVACS